MTTSASKILLVTLGAALMSTLTYFLLPADDGDALATEDGMTVISNVPTGAPLPGLSTTPCPPHDGTHATAMRPISYVAGYRAEAPSECPVITVTGPPTATDDPYSGCHAHQGPQRHPSYQRTCQRFPIPARQLRL